MNYPGDFLVTCCLKLVESFFFSLSSRNKAKLPKTLFASQDPCQLNLLFQMPNYSFLSLGIHKRQNFVFDFR